MTAEYIPQAADDVNTTQSGNNMKTKMKSYQRIRVMGKRLRTRVKYLNMD